jgi:EAL domain-containing protein (putative c-di-GMP-specific phosphodiesterase class I)/DNA-binding NarL/FixJ family response regulator
MTVPTAVRILVAEDDPTMRAALVEHIRSESSFELVGTAGDATDAIELAGTERPDVALVDVRMPHGGGAAAARGIVARSPGTKVIALSAHVDRTTVLKMLEAGVVSYLVKSADVDEIIEAIKSAKSGQGTLSTEVTSDVISELVGQLASRTRAREQERRRASRIRRALEDEHAFTMAFQPIVDLRDGRLIGAEALARFHRPPRRDPSSWFAEAEKVGLRRELEIAAVRKALAALAQLPVGTFLAVNVSPQTLGTPALEALVLTSEPHRIVSEITEHAPIHDYDRLDRALAPLRGSGIRLAVDDAGAGFASLRHILRLGPDLIKLDRTLIDHIDRDRSRQALAAGLISFAEKSGVTIIAEGIERAAELNALIELGVSFGQGFHLGRPGPLPPAGSGDGATFVPAGG